ncbi:metal-dependent hydrolase family protein [Sandaracinus amylolyticus]|uniref:metal-dependent hydrolase family protein n=1 Tax=Sandaracinus amylolyticus TaxID=927083 RepID=UPI00069D6D1D|nr:amidohydrolase family protein [Sandaracinus amylolyticus]
MSSEPRATLFSNVRVFDGRSTALSAPSHVLVRGHVIDAISTSPIAGAGDTKVIDGRGKTLTPGLVDAHWHATFATLSPEVLMTADPGFIHIVAAREAERTLMRGFTTVRDAGGPAFGLKRAIDTGVCAGPRIYPSGAFISQTSGHGDFRARHEVPRDCCAHLSYAERLGAAALADGVAEVLRASREQLMLGASQIKVMAGGGVSSPHDPIDVTQYTEDEMRAAVECAENWGTYVMVHAYTPRAVQQSIRAGVRCIEHGHLVDDETAAMMAARGVWWSMQTFLDDEDAHPLPTPEGRAKARRVFSGTDQAYLLAKKHGVKLAWGTDVLFDARLADRQGAQLAKLTRWFTTAQALRLATYDNAQLLALSGERNPYPGRLGVVEEGALADLLLVDGDPLADLGVFADPSSKLLVIMKDGELVKDVVSSQRASGT